VFSAPEGWFMLAPADPGYLLPAALLAG
jgi:hypothetical protein